MKPTPLYELAIATKGRPKVFRFIVFSVFIASLLMSLISTTIVLNEKQDKEKNFAEAQKQKRSNENFVLIKDMAINMSKVR